MGFCRQNIKALYLENEYRKIEGNFLCLGRQSVSISVSELESIFQKPFPLNNFKDFKVYLLTHTKKN